MAFIPYAALPRSGLSYTSTAVSSRPAPTPYQLAAPLDIRAAKHVQFKATKKHDRKRPKKRRPSDINRAPPSFNTTPLLEEGLPIPIQVLKPEDADNLGDEWVVLASAESVNEESLKKENFEGSVVKETPVEKLAVDSSEKKSQQDAKQVVEA